MATTKYQQFLEGMKFLREAEEAIDQARACFKSAGVYAQASGYRKPTIFELHVDTESMIRELETATCDECGAKYAECYCAEWGRVRVVTNHDRPPIPIRSIDWSAWIDGREEWKTGHGATEKEAIADLMERIRN